LGIFGQYHWLTERKVLKANSDSIGGPQYSFSGQAYTYGISLQAEL
jgi:hypothetical protein